MKQPVKKVLKPPLDYDFTLIGIISSLKDYSLAHFINLRLDIELARSPSYPPYLPLGKEVEGHFTVLCDLLNSSETEYYLFSNKGSSGHVIAEMKEVDHFLMIVPVKNHLKDEVLENLKRIDKIEKAFFIDVGRLKSKENLLFF